VLTSLVSACAHHKRGVVDVALLQSWGVWIFLGSIAGVLIANAISGGALTAVFGVVALAVTLYTALTPPDFRLRDRLPSGVVGCRQ